MNDNSQLTSYLNEYLIMDTPQFAVMITGKWGCGKTYYIKKRIEEWGQINIKTEEDSIVLKPIYISINGLSSISSVVRKIKATLYPLLHSKGAKVAKKVVLAALQIFTKSTLDLDNDGSGEELNDLLDTEGILEIFKSNSDSIQGNRILIIDDIERCKIPLDELFGFVNGIVEHSNSKVILVCNEEKLADVVRKENLSVEYVNFKEKLVGQTFSLAVDYANVTGSFIDARKNKILSDNRNLIIEIFVASKRENLRLIKHCLIDVERLFKQLPKDIKTNPNYGSFVTNVVAYLVLTSLEYRYGDTTINDYQSYSFTDTAKTNSQKFETKYNEVLERYQLYHSMYTIPIRYLIGFIQNGYLESPTYLLSECRMLRSQSMANWERLWRCNKLENDEFLKLIRTEKSRFFEKKLEYVFEVAHLAGILLSLEKKGLVKLSRNHVVRVAKTNMQKIFNNFSDEPAHITLNSQGYEFQESDTSEMNEIILFANQKYDALIKQREVEYIKSVWKKFEAGITHNELEKLFDKATPNRRSSYNMMSIFVQEKPKVMVERIVALSNANKIEFSIFLKYRYYLDGIGRYGSIHDDMKKDKVALKKISDGLKSKAKRQKLIDKTTTLEVANNIDKAVKKM